MKDKILLYFEKTKNYLSTDKGKSVISLLPLFFTWQPILVMNLENQFVKKNCMLGFLFTIYFFILLVVSFVLSYVPIIGQNIAGILHIFSVTIYLGLSFFFIYSILNDKNVEIKLLNEHIAILQKFTI